MADSGCSSDRTSRNVKSSSKKREEKFKRDEHELCLAEPRTPPLLSRRHSINELMKKRENLKRELKKFSEVESHKHSKSHSLKSKSRTDSSSRIRKGKYEIPRKRQNSSSEDQRDRKKQAVNTFFPEPQQNDTDIDSDDEEKIIEKRREERKKLIEKLSNSQNTEHCVIGSVGNDEKKPAKSSHSIDVQAEMLTEKSAPKVIDVYSKPDFPDKTKQPDVNITQSHPSNTAIDSDNEKIMEKRREDRKIIVEKPSHSQNTECGVIGLIDKECKEKPSEECHSIDGKAEIISPEKSGSKVTDMFSEHDFTAKAKPDAVTQDNNVENAAQLNDNWDDKDGYYNVRIGDIINDRYMVKNILGKGVFANVVQATDKAKVKDVAIKIVRHNELMFKTSLKEISFLKEIKEANTEGKHHCIKLLAHFIHKGHLCLVLEPLHMDLRSLIKKYGKNNGINDLRALMSYSRQLLLALKLLESLEIIHADIKPDNILINETKTTLKLCDFGSATKIGDQDYTPYLVSRFYRAPEIILGIRFNYGVDIWSVACTIFEIATGKILFTGSSNNRMLKSFMEVKGRFSSKLLKKGILRAQHFNYNNNFLLHKKDEYTGRDKVIEYPNITANRDLLIELKQFTKITSEFEKKKLLQLKDMLDKMLILDPFARISATDCLKHPFVNDVFRK